jgi:ubiquitin-conjugating enzyme E2 Z
MTLSALAVRRISIDCQRVLELADSGIFWVGDDARLTHGWAIVFGCHGTPYYGGAFCFEVNFPDNYPFAPPSFVYLTNDGRTRFNPNLYKNGKVCLSLLNTWAGEQWSGIQSLSSILQSIQTAVINENPLENEPAYPHATMQRDSPIYNRLILHATLETAILGYLKDPPAYLLPVYDAFRSWVFKARDDVLAKATELASEWDGKIETIDFYHMTQKYRFANLAVTLQSIS